jgi:hypothetical protein
MRNHAHVFAACLAATSFVVAQMQPVVSGSQGEGSVDWSQRYIVATGIAGVNPNLPESAQRASGLRAAKLLALRNALETVKGMYLNSSTTVQNFMTTSDVVTTQVNGYLKGFEQEGREKYMSDGSVEITMKIPLDGVGAVGDILFGKSVGEKPSITSFEGKKAAAEVIFTGLIIDCRGLKIKPALSPKVLDESGKEVYGSAYISREWATKYGVVGYSKDVAAAAKLDRVGAKPGTIKAAKASGDNSTDVVIAAADAEGVRSSAKNLKFLSECRVILVID